MNKIVVVTGAAAGIGRAITQCAADSGSTVILLDIREAPEAVEKIKAAGGTAFSYQCNVADPLSVKKVFSHIHQAHGAVDVLINNAGTMGRWPVAVTEATDRDWHTIFETNVKSTFLCCRQVLPAMRAKGTGVIVNIGSELAMVGAEGCSLYCASKAAIVHFTRALAVDEARHGIRVNCVSPGPVDTNLLNPTAGNDEGVESARISSARSTLVNRLGTPEEIAKVTWFVASAGVDFMTGSAILVDGGVTAV